jgi:hypothetical protein
MNSPDEATVRRAVRDMWRGIGTAGTWEQISAWFAARDLAHYELLPDFAALVRSEWDHYVNESDPVAGCVPPAQEFVLVATVPPVDPLTFEHWRFHYQHR